MSHIDLRYLDQLQEECAEVIVAISKIKRFGYHDVWEGIENKQRFMEEVGDVLAIMHEMNLIDLFTQERADFFIHTEVSDAVHNKFEKLKIFGPDGSYIKSTNTV